MKGPFHSIVSLLVVFVYTVVSMGTAQAELLCIGGDGHIAIEGPAERDKCHGEPLLFAPASDPVVRLSGGGEGTECVDFALLGKARCKTRELRVKAEPAAIAWLRTQGLPPTALLPGRARECDIRAPYARSLTSHRTTILLI